VIKGSSGPIHTRPKLSQHLVDTSQSLIPEDLLPEKDIAVAAPMKVEDLLK
jgi:hypothetical protein